MGNCQAINAAVLVLQHPGGKIDRYYGCVSVKEVMAMYPGHYVSLIIPLTEEDENIPADEKNISADERKNNKRKKSVRFTRVKLLRPTENLVLGHAYRLITSQEVMKVLREKKYAKNNKHNIETKTTTTAKNLPEKKVPEKKQEKQQLRVVRSSNSLKSKTWRPSLQSISEATS